MVEDSNKAAMDLSNDDTEFINFTEQIKTDIRDQGFSEQPRGIHSKLPKLFYRDILKADKDTLELLEQGYIPRFKTPIQNKVELSNNLSAKHNMGTVRKQVAEWLIKGYVEKVDHIPFFVNPLTVATRHNSETGALTYRTCCDLSRTLNPVLEECHSKLDDMRTVLPRYDYVTDQG